jgi:hypothetical protein
LDFAALFLAVNVEEQSSGSIERAGEELVHP